ncbi:non-ribosomal peptide synthetase [Nocardia sp. BMG111209]|uniref:non-ribosomal peptide synthetase n=1 Tax=Nocardia sp. BMG111209 TaxID=1160137 RepID=UPI00035D6894|nr:non-ribosomal peptide synthetase [Nocardia sp. BMG111209]
MPFLHDLLVAQATKAPDDIAALYGDDAMTFAEIDAAADRVAAALVARGVRPGDRVGLHMLRSLTLVPAVFGLLRAGGVCVPIDPEDPVTRRATILEHSGVTVVLTERALRGSHDADEVEAEAAVSGAPLTRPVDLDDDAPAFAFYTSGSTGVPKGVVLTHRALLSGQQWLQSAFPLEPGRRQLLRTTLSITNLVREVFWPMLFGGTIVIVPPGAHKDPDRLVEMINEYDVAVVLVLPALLSGMLDNPAFAANTSLEYVFCSSDVMPGDLPERYFATGPGARLFNLYGLTEALYCTRFECLRGAAYDGFVPVGSAAELTPHILDDTLGPVPDGGTGELCMTGAGMSSGYSGLPELTAARFVDTVHGRTFRTGDLARRSADGRIELLGRMDDQVKIAGFRVELGEVEVRLRELPGVEDAVAVGQRGANGHQRLIAYLIGDGDTLTAAAIRERLSERLPDHMVPAAFVVVDAIPLTHNTKVDRRALMDLPGRQLAATESYTAPRTELETYLCGVWAEQLSVPEVGIHDNFFALGGDSIQGFLVSAKAHRDGVALSTTQVFDTPTVAETARYVATGPARAAAADPAGDTMSAAELAAVRRAAADPAGIENAYPLTPTQLGMLFHSLLDADSGVYFEQIVHALDGELDVAAYQRAWQQVADRHEILRVRIATRDLPRPMQVVQRGARPEWTTVDWSGRADWPDLLADHLGEDRRRGFDLDRAPLLRLTLVRLGTTTFELVISYHHLILDAWSLSVLLRDVLEIYRADRAGVPPQLAPARSFGDYVTFLERQDGTAARQYWAERLAEFGGPTVIGTSTRLGLSASAQELHAEARLDLGEQLTEQLLDYGRAHQLTLNSMVQAAWAIVLGGFGDRSDVCFGITVTHRPLALAGVEDIVGIFINTMPMRVRLEDDRAIGVWLQRIQHAQVAARAHDHYPLPSIQQHTDLPNGQLMFESLLVFENFPRRTGWTGRGGVDMRQERYVGWTNYPLAIEAVPEQQLYFRVTYDRACFDANLVDTVLAAFRDVLAAIATGGSGTVGDLVHRVAANRPQRPEPLREKAFPARGTAVRAPVATAPRTDREAALAAIWSEVLEVDEVDVGASFLALGGSSLAGMHLAGLARAAGFDVSVADLFRAELTVRDLANR